MVEVMALFLKLRGSLDAAADVSHFSSSAC